MPHVTIHAKSLDWAQFALETCLLRLLVHSFFQGLQSWHNGKLGAFSARSSFASPQTHVSDDAYGSFLICCLQFCSSCVSSSCREDK